MHVMDWENMMRLILARMLAWQRVIIEPFRLSRQERLKRKKKYGNQNKKIARVKNKPSIIKIDC